MNPRRTDTESDSQVENGKDEEKTEEHQKFWPRVWADFSDKELLPIKFLFFIKSGTVFVLYPYLTLHIKSLGLETDKAGLSNALTIFTIIGQPLAGVISDKIGNFKLFLSVTTFLTPIPALLLLTVPLARETITLPPNLTFSLQCQTHENSGIRTTGNPSVGTLSALMTFTSISDDECIPVNETDVLNRKQLLDAMQVVQCGYICEEKIDSHHPQSFSKLTRLPVPFGGKYLIPGAERKLFMASESQSQVEDHAIQCTHYNFQGTEQVCTVDVETELSQAEGIHWDNLYANDSVGLQSGIAKRVSNDDPTVNFRNCQQVDPNRNENCSSACIALVTRKEFCKNDKIERVYDETLTFWLYNVFRVILGLFSATCWIMYEGAVLAIMKEKNGDYGIQRASSFLAAVIAAPLSGYMISYFNDFRPAFYLYAVLQVICSILTMKIHLEFRQPAKQIFGSLWKVLKKAQVIGLMLAVLCSGTAWGFLESFLFWFLQNLGGSGLLMGLTITVGGLAGLPFLIVNKPIINKLGHVNTIAMGLLFYGIRLVGYSFINDPWMCLPLEALEAVTASLAITAANTYAAELADKETVVSIQGIVGALYYSVGRSVGSVIGGYLIQAYGERETYQILAAGSFVTGLIYMLFNFFYQLHQRRQQRFKNINLPQASLDDNRLQGLKFDGGYVGPFSVLGFTENDS